MDPRNALVVLVEASAMEQADKERIRASLPTLSDEEVQELGRALAEQKKADAAAAARATEAIDRALEE